MTIEYLVFALLVTLIIMLILASISLSGLIGGKGLFKRTEDASNIYNEKKAREVLETVLLTDGQFEKNTNPKYNQDEFLDELIKKEIPGSDIKGDVAIIGGEYAYELDRSVPKIGTGGNNGYLGSPKDLVWPEVVIVNEPTLIESGREATFKIKATIDEKAAKGITRIELWLNGKKLNQDREYENEQREVEEEYIVNRNGVYTIKAYAELMGSNKTTVEGIVPAIKFSPNGNMEWKKQHTTKIIVEETTEIITEMKYVWTDSEEEPNESSFTETCINNSMITGGDDTMTGTYYLWVLVTFEGNKTNVCGSKGFNFDNEAPTTELTSTPESETSFTLTATASDRHSGIAKYEFYLDGTCIKEYNINDESVNLKVDYGKMGEPQCEVRVLDKLGNTQIIAIKSRTKLYFWKKCTILNKEIWEEKTRPKADSLVINSRGYHWFTAKSIKFDDETGMFNIVLDKVSSDVSESKLAPVGSLCFPGEQGSTIEDASEIELKEYSVLKDSVYTYKFGVWQEGTLHYAEKTSIPSERRTYSGCECTFKREVSFVWDN